MPVRITCIKKDRGNHYNPHEAITDFGWINEQDGVKGQSSRGEMVKFIETDKGEAYVKDQQGNKAYVGVCKNAAGNKYLRTHADGMWTDNLLPLPECG